MSRLSTLFFAFGEFHGWAKRFAIVLTSTTLVWLVLLVGFRSHLTPVSIGLIMFGPLLSLGGYLAGMLFPYWRINWAARVGAAVAIIAAILIWKWVPFWIGALLIWHPLFVGWAMFMYHEKLSVYTVRGGAKVGDKFPEFNLPDTSGTPQNLTSILAAGPTLFTAYRGDW